MDVRVVVSPANNGYRVRIIGVESPVRSWLKVYPTKETCLSELRAARLITQADHDEVIADASSLNEAMLVFTNKANDRVLCALGYTEQKRVHQLILGGARVKDTSPKCAVDAYHDIPSVLEVAAIERIQKILRGASALIKIELYELAGVGSQRNL
jgi:hypothetical protein